MIHPESPCVACIGSRQLAASDLAFCRALADALTAQGWTLVTGGATGADQAFAEGAAPSRLVLVVPWAGFHAGSLDPLVARGARRVVATLDDPRSQAALATHPARDRLGPGGTRLIARDGWIVAPTPGRPVAWCIAWPGSQPGGTGFTQRLARRQGIRVSDLRDPAVRARAAAWAGLDHPPASSPVFRSPDPSARFP